MDSPTVATYPSAGGRREGSRVCLPREEDTWSRHQRLFEEKVRKTGTCGLRTLIMKGSGVVFTHGKGISTSRIRHKGQQPLIKCAISCLQFVLFSPFYVLCFLWVFCIFYLFVVDKCVSLAPTYPQLR